MHPLLLKVGSIPIHTYGALIAVGFLVAIFVVQRLAAKSKLEVERILDFSFWCFLVGLVGARLLFVLTRLDFFADEPMAIFRVWEGGFVFFGGPLAVLPFAVWYLRKH